MADEEIVSSCRDDASMGGAAIVPRLGRWGSRKECPLVVQLSNFRTYLYRKLVVYFSQVIAIGNARHGNRHSTIGTDESHAQR